MKRILAAMMIAALTLQLSAGTVFAAGQTAQGMEIETNTYDYPADWAPDDPMNAKAYEQIFGAPESEVSMQSVTPKSGVTTTWKTTGGTVKSFTHNDFNLKDRELKVGIDVSYHNGKINWTKVKNAGVEFAILRVGYRGSSKGTLNEDVKFQEYIKGAKDAGIKVGVYFFSQAISEAEAVKEAEYTLEKIKGYELDLPVCFDYEYYADGRLKTANLSKSKKTANARAFCETIERAGYPAMIYSSTTWFLDELDAESLSEDYGLWMARYNYTSYNESANNGQGEKTRYGGRIDIWQCTEEAAVSGIGTRVDLDYWYCDPNKYMFDPLKVTPSIKQGSRTENSVRVDIGKIKGMSGYEIYYSANRKDNFHLVTLTAGQKSYEIKKLSPGREYYVKVRGFVVQEDGTVKYGKMSSLTPMTTTVSQAKRVKTKTGVVMRSWAGTEYKKVVTVPKSTAMLVQTTAKATDGKYWYKVSYTKNGKTYTGYIPKENVSNYVAQVSGLGQSGNEKTAITLKWKKLSEASGYEIYRASALNGTYKLIKTVKGAATTTYTNKSRSAGTEYYYKVRAYQTVNGKKKYGAFSTVKVLHTKVAKTVKIRTRYSVNLRKYAGTAYKTLKTVPSGQKFTVLYQTKDKSGKTWYKVKYKVKKKTYTGYIMAKYTKKV
ncbi:MAG: GH25 family lysozyme [Eubacterium sp.]